MTFCLCRVSYTFVFPLTYLPCGAGLPRSQAEEAAVHQRELLAENEKRSKMLSAEKAKREEILKKMEADKKDRLANARPVTASVAAPKKFGMAGEVVIKSKGG